jgi:hypothetical protein
MKKTLCALLALILILGAVGCGTGEKLPEQQTEPITVVETEKTSEPAATEPTAEPIKTETEPEPETAEPTVEPEKPEPEPEPAQELPLFDPSAYPSSQWYMPVVSNDLPYVYSNRLTVFEDGSLQLTIDLVDYRLIKDGDAFRLEKDFYATPLDPMPARTLDAGTVCFRELTLGGQTLVRVEAVQNPLNVFSNDPRDLYDMTAMRNPYIYRDADTPQAWGYAPQMQPNTEWIERERHPLGDGYVVYGNSDVTVAQNGAVSGYIKVAHEAEREDCVLLWAPDAGALVRPGENGELLYFGGLAHDPEETREQTVHYALRANYDPYDLSTGRKLVLIKINYGPDPASVLGREKNHIVEAFTEDGWTNEPLSMKWGEYADYGELFLKLTKDGRMLLIYLDEDFGIYDHEEYAAAYLLFDATGTLESWGGFKPFDHTLFDGHDLKDALTHVNGVLPGLAEDDDIYLLDDGRILVTSSGHESGELLDSVIFDPRNP